MTRRTLDQLPAHIPTPDELYQQLTTSKGWNYRDQEKIEFYRLRDLSLPSLLYLASLRVSEAVPLIKKQFSQPTEDERGKYILLKDIALAKRRPGNIKTNNIELPLEGERAKFTALIREYIEQLEPEQRLFPWSLEKVKVPNGFYINKKTGVKTQRYSVRMIGTARAWQIVNALLPEITEHWLRAFGEDFFYVLSGKDVIATAHKFKVDPRTLADWYLQRRHMSVEIR